MVHTVRVLARLHRVRRCIEAAGCAPAGAVATVDAGAGPDEGGEGRSGGEHNTVRPVGFHTLYCVRVGYTVLPSVHTHTVHVHTRTHVPPVVEEKIVRPAVDQRGGLSRDQWNAVLVDGEVLVRQHDLVIGKGGGGAEEQGEEEG